MPVPTAITDLSQTAASNSPAGSESPITTDNYLRQFAAFIAQLQAEKAPKASPTFTGTITGAAATLYGALFGAAATFSGALSAAAATFSGLLTTNGQVKFPATQNASADANTLDDYEEGTWSPVIIGADSAGSYTPGTVQARYVKIGRLVFIKCNVTWTSHSGSGFAVVQGLPFVGDSTGAAYLSSLNTSYYYEVSDVSALINTNLPVTSTGAIRISGTYLAGA